MRSPLCLPALLSLVSCLSAGLLTAQESDGSGSLPATQVEESVVKVFATMTYPDPIRPWTRQAPRETTGSGVIIDGGSILTNAHLVLYASQVFVQLNQSGDKLAATVEHVAPGIDLAVLKLEESELLAGRKPLERAVRMPEIKEAVMVYGYPTGGTSLSITKGIVSRIEFARYNFPVSGLRIQIDAAINPGNSGGPAMAGERMVGLAYSRLGGADNIGYIIPTEEIELFLQDVADGRYDGKPGMYDALQTFQNPALRDRLQAGRAVEGLVVSALDSDDPAYPLRKWDVITRIGDDAVDNEGMINLGNNLRVRFGYRIQHLAQAGLVPLKVWRDGREQDIQMPVQAEREMLIPDLEGAYPPYFILGPVVFSVATVQLAGPLSGNVKAVQAMMFAGSPLITRRGEKLDNPGEQLVIISSPFFPHKLAKGYGNPVARSIRSVNGTAVRNLAHLVELVRDSQDEFLTFEMNERGAEALVFNRQELIDATEEVLSTNGVRAQASPELLAIWQTRG